MLDTTYLLWYSSIVVQFLFCLYLVWTRLAKSYPVFTIYLAVSVLSSLCGIYFMRGANGPRLPLAYTYYWLCAEPVILLAQIAVTLEVHAGMWRGHEAVSSTNASPASLCALNGVGLRGDSHPGGATTGRLIAFDCGNAVWVSRYSLCL